MVAVEAVTGKSGLSDFEAVAQLHEISGVALPSAVDGLETAPVRHKTTVAATICRLQLGLWAVVRVPKVESRSL